LQFKYKAVSTFAQILTFNPDVERIVEMLSEDELIAYCVNGTEHPPDILHTPCILSRTIYDRRFAHGCRSQATILSRSNPLSK